jgi:son of sevenless
MVQDEDILEKDDMYILDRMREFLKQDDVYQFAASKGLLTLIERSVCTSAIYSAHHP